MKTRIAMNELKYFYDKVFRTGYCDLCDIMNGYEPRFYNCGVYGWNCDIYTAGNIAITTGYRNMRGERIPSEILQRYTKKAQQIRKNRQYKWETKTRKLEENREKFFAELAAL